MSAECPQNASSRHLNGSALNGSHPYFDVDFSGHTLREAALHYAFLGLPVFPCVPNEKRPLTSNGYKAATTDAAVIEDWWSKTPNANIGLALDAANLVAFDPDLYKPDCEWDTFVRDRQLPSTLTQATASGGKHFVFQAEPGRKYPASLCKHVDVKHAGYILVAPSVFNGKQYRWERNTAPVKAPNWFEQPTVQLPFQVPTTDGPNEAEIQELLSYVNADCEYGEWLNILMAVHAATNGSQSGLVLADQWSATGSKYQGSSDVEARWKSFNGSGVTVSTLAETARLGGADLAAIAHRHKYDPAKVFAGHPIPAVPSPIPTPVAPKFDIFSADKLSGVNVQPRDWLVPDLIPKGDITLLGGDGGTGKSLIALQLAASVAAGQAWLNKFVFRSSALFISAEDTRDEIHRRLDAVRQAYNITYEDLNALHLLSLAGEDAILASPARGNILVATPVFQALKNAVSNLRPSLLVLDTLADLFGGEENQRAQARQFIQLLRKLCIEFGTTIVLLNHPSLSGINSGSGSSGSTGWNNSVRSRLYLERIVDDAGHESNVDARRLSTKKANYARASGDVEMVWRDGLFQPIAPSLLNSTGDQDDALFLRILSQFANEGRHVSPHKSSTYAPTTFVSHPLNNGVSKHRFEQAMNRLLMAGKIKNVEHGPPSKRRNFLALVEVSA